MGLDIEVVDADGKEIYYERFGHYSSFVELRQCIDDMLYSFSVPANKRRRHTHVRYDVRERLPKEDRDAHERLNIQSWCNGGFDTFECKMMFRFFTKFETYFALSHPNRIEGKFALYLQLMKVFKLAADNNGSVKFC